MLERFSIEGLLLRVISVVWVAVLVMLLLPAKGFAVKVGDKAPDFHAVTITGHEVSYAKDFEGRKPVYLVFWTTWCPHCQREMPLIEKLYKEFGGKIEFIGINLGIKEDIDKFVKKRNITFPIIFDEGEKIAKSFDAKIQTNILIDRNGIVTYDERGLQDDIRKYLEKLLKP